MSLKHKSLVGLVLVVLSGIGSVVASTVPGLVTDVSMVVTSNGEIAVTWSPATDASSYRIYFSRESILGNQGDYDDFIETDGADTTYVFSSAPIGGDVLYVSVLAVSVDGTESDGFVSEAYAMLPEKVEDEVPSPVVPEEQMEPVTTTSEPLSIASVAAQSATGVLVQFSKAIKANLVENPFVLTTTGGELLGVTDVSFVGGSALLLTTVPQVPGTKYMLSIVANILAQDGTSMTTSAPRVLFDGFGGATVAPTAPEPTYGRNPHLPTDLSPPSFGGPTSVSATVKRDANDKTLTVTLLWTPVPFASKYKIYASVDSGSFEQIGEVPGDRTSVVLRKIRSPRIQIKVSAVGPQGQESEGVLATVPLPTGTSEPLTETGLPLLGVMLAAGAVAGSRLKIRRKK